MVKKHKHKKWKPYDWHVWLGFNIIFLTTLLLAAVTLATITNEIEWLIQNDIRVAQTIHLFLQATQNLLSLTLSLTQN
jgi:hypothetical protein